MVIDEFNASPVQLWVIFASLGGIQRFLLFFHPHIQKDILRSHDSDAVFVSIKLKRIAH
jgi:hypothetical protein